MLIRDKNNVQNTKYLGLVSLQHPFLPFVLSVVVGVDFPYANEHYIYRTRATAVHVFAVTYDVCVLLYVRRHVCEYVR